MRTIALVHAFGSSGRAWAPQAAGLEDRSRILAPDLPRPGDTTASFTLPAAVESVVAAIDGAGGSAHLVGISGGAVVALLTCLEHPCRVTSLVLSAGVAHPPRWFALQRAVMRAIPEPSLGRARRATLSGGRPGAVLQLVPGPNHLWNLQQPEAFNRILAAFVERATPAQR